MPDDVPASDAPAPVIDLNDRRLERLLAALKDFERWADNRAAAPYTDPDWVFKRGYVADHDNATAEEYMLELYETAGIISAYVDAGGRVADLRGQIVTDGSPRDRYEAVFEALRGELAWADTEREEAFLAVGSAIVSEELKAKGRAKALVAIRVELRSLQADVVEVFYNSQRLHSTLGYRTPADAEQDHHTAAKAA